MKWTHFNLVGFNLIQNWIENSNQLTLCRGCCSSCCSGCWCCCSCCCCCFWTFGPLRPLFPFPPWPYWRWWSLLSFGAFKLSLHTFVDIFNCIVPPRFGQKLAKSAQFGLESPILVKSGGLFLKARLRTAFFTISGTVMITN